MSFLSLFCFPFFTFSFLTYILFLFFNLLVLSTFWLLILRLADAHSSRRTIPQGFTAVIGILYSFIFKVIAFFSFSIQSPIYFLTKLDISQPFRETIAGSEINVFEIVWFQAYYFIMVSRTNNVLTHTDTHKSSKSSLPLLRLFPPVSCLNCPSLARIRLLKM